MARLGIARDFLGRYAKLEKKVQRAVDEAIAKFGEHTHAGLHLEKLENARDPRIRTIRITQSWRGVVLAPPKGDEYVLLSVMAHDDAIDYATSRVFTVNQILGVLEIRNQEALEQIEPALQRAAASTQTRLFDHVKDKEFIRLGIDPNVLPLIRLLTEDAHIDTLAPLLPEPQRDALVALAAGMTSDEVWQEVSRYLVQAPPYHVDPHDLAMALERTPHRYAMVSGPDELADILAHPFAAWRVFLHPSQRDIAYRDSYDGPVLVTGGAGTGKTVTAMHRAVFLARRPPVEHERPTVLLTTFSRNLAESLDSQLALLAPDGLVRGQIDVVNVDRLAHRVVAEAQGRRPRVPDPMALNRLWQNAAGTISHEFDPAFLEGEWEHVVLAQDIRDPASYLACRRSGRGNELTPAERERVWSAITHVTDQLRRLGQRTHHQLADEAARILGTSDTARYRHVIVDEGQDLHPSQWRLLRAAAAVGTDDMFIVSDPHQRIYDNRVSLDSVGITTGRRRHRLTVNYRNTQEILDWSVHLLTGQPPTGLDDRSDGLTGYRSPLHGDKPAVRGYPDRDSEADGLVRQVRAWIGAGVEGHAIGVAARSGRRANEIRETLDFAGISTASVNTRGEGVRVDTMHAMKGLEFRCVAVVGVDEDVLPVPGSVALAQDDPLAREHDLQRERCVLFVACTRARDALYVSHTRRPSPFLTGVTS